MRKLTWALFGSVILLIFGEPLQADPGVSGWKFDGGRSCSLYSTSDKRFIFIAAKSPEEWVLRVHDKEWGIERSDIVRFRIIGAGEDQYVDAVPAETSNGWSGLVAAFTKDLIEATVANEEVAVNVEQRPSIIVRLAELKTNMEQLRSCANNLPPLPPVEQRVAHQARLITSLAINPSRIRTEDRPDNPLVFRLAIDVNGKTVGCDIIESSGSPDLDQKMCSLLRQRARFKPATNLSGVPVPSTYQSRIVF